MSRSRQNPVNIMKAKSYETANVRKMAKKGTKIGQSQELPVDNSPSNQQYDKLGLALYITALTLALVTFVGGSYYCITQIIEGLQARPIQWMVCILMAGFFVGAVYTARTLVWLGFFGTVMMCSRMGAWMRSEETSRIAIKLDKFMPNGTGWASLALCQSLLQRGQYQESLAVAEDEWRRNGENVKQATNMGPMCAYAGTINQVEGNIKQTLVWNDRALNSFNFMLEDYTDPKKNKSFMRKFAKSQTTEWLGQLKLQMAGVYYTNAQIHMNVRDFRRSKECFKKAVEMAVQSPDSPQRSDILKASKEQLGRLKHS